MSSQIRQARINLMKMWADIMPDDTFFWYGKRLGMFSAPLTVQVYGWTATQTPAELSPEYKVEEQFDLSCCVSSFQGDQDFDAREAEAIAAFEILTEAVANNYTLAYPVGPGGGPVRWAYVTDYEFTPDVTATQGQSVGTLDFKIQGQQRIETQS
jgi:hypothetical protein